MDQPMGSSRDATKLDCKHNRAGHGCPARNRLTEIYGLGGPAEVFSGRPIKYELGGPALEPHWSRSATVDIFSSW